MEEKDLFINHIDKFDPCNDCINISDEDKERFIKALSNPPEPNKELKRLFKMKIQVNLKDYQDEIKTFDVELSGEKLTIVYTIQSGDEVVYIFEDNQKIYTLDSSDNRTTDFLDEIKLITIEELVMLNKEKE